MDNLLPENETTEVEGRLYLNPQTGVDENQTFIDQLRATQGQQNQEISTDTRMLGTDIPSVQGGLLGSDSYFTSRYQTPQTNAAVASLRATAQAKALNDVLSNQQEMWKKRYQDAYKNYQKRQYDKANSYYGGGNPGTNNPSIDGNDGLDTKKSSDELDTKSWLSVDSTDLPGQYVMAPNGIDLMLVTPNGDNIVIPQLRGVSKKTGVSTYAASTPTQILDRYGGKFWR